MIVSETWSRGRRRSIACRGRDREQGPRRQEEDGGADQALPGRPPAAPQLAKITSHILQLNKSWRAARRLGGGRAGPGRRRHLPSASSVLARGLSCDKLWNAVAPYSTFRLRSNGVYPGAPASIRCLPNTLLYFFFVASTKVKMDALASVGDLPRDTLTTALLQSSSEDDLRDMRVKLFETAREKGLAHPKDILVKRLKRAVGPSLGKKCAIDIADLCYALRNEQLFPRTLLKNGKRSAAAFIAARSRVSSSPQTSDNALPSTASIDGTTRGSHDSVSHNCSEI